MLISCPLQQLVAQTHLNVTLYILCLSRFMAVLSRKGKQVYCSYLHKVCLEEKWHNSKNTQLNMWYCSPITSLFCSEEHWHLAFLMAMGLILVVTLFLLKQVTFTVSAAYSCTALMNCTFRVVTFSFWTNNTLSFITQ